MTTTTSHYANSSLVYDHHLANSTVNETSLEHDGNEAEEICALHSQQTCEDGLLLHAWLPDVDEIGSGTKVYRALIYLLSLAYILFGVNIITDKMVSAIEVIVAHKRTVRMKTPSGEVATVKVPIFHPVVATLTVFVIGASAAEIFLPTIEIVTKGFEAAELGPALIFGSAAYHLFIIMGLCISSVKETAGKPIQDQRVFFVTTSFAIFAYLWMYFLLDLISPGEITLWEAILTLLFFPLLVFIAWFVERKLDRFIWRRFLQCTGLVSPAELHCVHGEDLMEATRGPMLETERRRRLAALLKDLKTSHPEKSEMELEEMAQLQMLESVPKGAAFYRMQASKDMSGGGQVISKDKIKKKLEHEQKLKEEQEQANSIDPNAQLVGFEQSNYTCMESCVLMVVTVHRSGHGVANTTLLVDFTTVAETAIPGDDYEETSGTLEFKPGCLTADVVIKIVDDDEFEEDKDFKVVLDRPRLKTKAKKIGDFAEQKFVFTLKETTIRILDDDHCGVFHFETTDTAVPDNVGTAKIKVLRTTGARGRVQLPFTFTDSSAKEGQDYTPLNQKSITFENDQSEGFIEVGIVDANRVGEVFAFFIELGEPIILSQAPQNPLGNPVLGDVAKVKVGICEDDELAEALDRLLRLGDIADLISDTSWKEQFLEALSQGGEGQEEEEDIESGSESKPCRRLRCKVVKKYIVYTFSLPWKLLAAAIPPAGYFHGWLAFVILLLLMAFISALIGDLATAFGCTIGLKDTVTAITLIAFGMGLPDTFASRHAAMHEKTADAAIGHITGSNAVNVFLGIGLSWTIGAAYHAYHGESFKLPHTNMGFVVAIYCALATGAVLILLIRRLPPIRGELGGPRSIKYVSAFFFLFLWVTFVLLLTLQSYCAIPSF